jgi:DNA gyrase subunit A
MNVERPDLTHVAPVIRAYIEALEAELERLQRPTEPRSRPAVVAEAPLIPHEPPTTLNVITVSAGGIAKRTPRHLYERQRRGGMGVFDLDTSPDDPPAFLVVADQDQALVLVTNQARAFRLPVGKLPESPVRSRGQSLVADLPLRPDERLAFVLPTQESGYAVLLSQRGHVRRLRYHYFNENLRPGTLLYDLKELGAPAAACWTTGEDELFIVTRRGRAIRFAERLVPTTGCLGLRLEPGDTVAGITVVQPDSGVFLLSADGKGTIRLMAGFSSNKAPGASGKIAVKTDDLVGAVTVGDNDDIFAISRLSKIIRFQAVEVPAKEGVVQGVNCMTLRADETAALTGSSAAVSS